MSEQCAGHAWAELRSTRSDRTSLPPRERSWIQRPPLVPLPPLSHPGSWRPKTDLASAATTRARTAHPSPVWGLGVVRGKWRMGLEALACFLACNVYCTCTSANSAGCPVSILAVQRVSRDVQAFGLESSIALETPEMSRGQQEMISHELVQQSTNGPQRTCKGCHSTCWRNVWAMHVAIRIDRTSLGF